MLCNIGWRWTFIIYSPQIQPLAFSAAFVGRAKCFQRVNVFKYGVFGAFQEPLNLHHHPTGETESTQVKEKKGTLIVDNYRHVLTVCLFIKVFKIM